MSTQSANAYSYRYSELSFLDKPEAKILLGASLIPENIREGADVYFDCIIDAQPGVYKVEWKHNVSSEFLECIQYFIFPS